MAVRQGYGKLAGTDALVFGYDMGDMLNSFKGKPTTNLLTRIGYDYGEQNSNLFKSHYGYEEVYIPALGKKNAHFCEIYNDYNGGSGNCCLSLFSFGNFSVSPSTTYTYQIIYKTTTGYANGNYMYHYEYGPGGYVTEYGLWSSSREEDLGDGWKHAWGTFTTNANTSTFYTYLFHYEYATFNKVQLAGVMLTQGSEIFRPQQFIPVGNGLTNTGGLLDLTGNSLIDISNVSFDSNAQMVFDGSNDYASVGYSTAINTPNGATYEIMLYPQAAGEFLTRGKSDSGTDPDNPRFYVGGSGNIYFDWSITGADTYVDTVTGTATLNQWNHIVGVAQPGDQLRVYVNGVQASYGTVSRTLPATLPNTSDPIIIGGVTWIPRYFTGKVGMVKLYNRNLTPTEIKENFNGIRSRYGI